MTRILLLAMTCLFALATTAMGQGRELKSVKFEIKPESAVALSFAPDKVVYVSGKIKIWASVKNTGPDDYTWVEVWYTALDKNRNVLGRDMWHVDSFDIASGEIGTVDGGFIKTRGRIPAIIEVEVLGEIP